MTNKDKIVERFLKQVLVLDTESTGIDPEIAEICEIGHAGSINGRTASNRSVLFGTKEPIPFAASSKNNISRKMLAGLPTFEENLEDVVDMLALLDDNINYFAAHNYEYDRTILISNFTRANQKEFAEHVNNRKWICTYRLVQHLFKPTEENKDFGYSLSYLRYAFDLPTDGLKEHRAGDDSEICWYLLRYICYYVLDNVIDQNDITEDFDLGEFLYELSKSPIEITAMPFGKHKGTPLENVPMDYYNWLLKNSDMLDETSPGYDEDFALSIEKELNRRLSLK